MFKNLLGKKNDGFYLQIDESAQTTPEPAASATPAAVVAEAPTSQTSEPKQPAKTSVKDNKKKKEIAPTVAPVSTPVVETIAATTVSTFTTFAPDYLIKPSSDSSRRRPGANMKSFLDLARQMPVKK